jgi:hypothetical protein
VPLEKKMFWKLITHIQWQRSCLRTKNKRVIFWHIMPCSLLLVNWHLRRTCCFHLQDQRISQARNQHEAGIKKGRYVPLKYQLTFNLALYPS